VALSVKESIPIVRKKDGSIASVFIFVLSKDKIDALSCLQSKLEILLEVLVHLTCGGIPDSLDFLVNYRLYGVLALIGEEYHVFTVLANTSEAQVVMSIDVKGIEALLLKL